MTVVSTSATSPSISFAVSVKQPLQPLLALWKKGWWTSTNTLKIRNIETIRWKATCGGFQLNTTEYNRKSKETPWKAYVPSIVHIYNRTEIVLPVPFFLQSHGAGSRYFSIFMPQTLQVVLRTLYATSLLIHPPIHPSIHSSAYLLFHPFIHHPSMYPLDIVPIRYLSYFISSTCAWTFLLSVLFLYLSPSISLTIDNIDIAIWVRIVPQYPLHVV